MKKRDIAVFLLASVLAFSGWGCGKAGGQGEGALQPAGPKAAAFDGLTPEQASKKINLTASSVLYMHQSFSGTGEGLAKAQGWGKEAETTIVVSRFAPGFNADVEWKMRTVIGKDAKEFAGAIRGINLQDSHELYLPAYWTEGEKTAMGTGVLWLSQDVYENLFRNQVSTFSLGLQNRELYQKVEGGAELDKAVSKLESDIAAIIKNKDVYLFRSEQPTEWTLKLNGKDVKVQVFKVKSWFGEMVVLDNKQNPLVLKVTTEKLADGALSGFFDHEITELKDLQE